MINKTGGGGEKVTLENFFDGVESGDIEKVRKLLSEGADVNSDDKQLRPHRYTKHGPDLAKPFVTPLHQASERGNIEMVRLLLDHGANVDGHDGYGNTPLFYAVEDNNIEVVRLLLERGANTSAKNSAGWNLFSMAKNPEMANLLRQYQRR
jgi:ankyrin repeat protein